MPEQGVLDGVPQERRIADLIHDFAPMQQATDVPGLFAGLARSIVRTVRADACLVSLIDDEGRRLRDVAASVVPPAKLNVVAEEFELADFPATAAVIATRQPAEISISDEEADEAERAYLDGLGFRRVLMCALTVDGRPLGTIEAYRTVDRPFRRDDPDHIDVLAAFAGATYSRIQIAAKLEKHYMKTIEALTSALEARDPYTLQHTSRMRDMAVGLALALKVPEDVRASVKLGAILHDVGKIGVPDAILRKPGSLTDEEWVKMKEHVLIGERMLRGIEFLWPALPVVRHHHERWDGAGYPDGLEGHDIPLAARIVAVCDAYDAMTSDRPYRKALAHSEACEELLKTAGKQHDPTCSALLVDIVQRLGDEQLEERFVRYSS